MNRVKKILLGMAVILPVFTVSPVFAVESTDGSTGSNTSTTQTTQQQKPKTGNEGLTLQQRVQKYQEAAKTRLTNAQKLLVASRCKAAQGKVSSVKGRVTGLETSRTQVYGNLQDRLTKLSEKLKAKTIDTTTYDAQVAELKTMIDTYNTDLAKYREAVTDLSEMECTTNPDGFKAALEAARTARVKVVADGQAIKTYLNGTLKPTIQALHDQVKTEGSN